MYNPQSAYRIQFHKGFTFLDFEQIIPYLHQLGVKTIYASPVFEAMPGSTHGYDGLDPNMINPEIGTKEQLYAIASRLKRLGMGWIQDFVPNHMAHSPQNKWLCDFLEKGKMSAYNDYFDKNPDEPLMAPFLGAPLDEVLQNGEISIVYRDEKLQVTYFDTLYPLNYTAYTDILNDESLDEQGFDGLRVQLDQLSQCTEQGAFNDLWVQMLKILSDSLEDEIRIESFNTSLARMCSEPHWIKQILDAQFYRLCSWKETDTRINYRRFFTINGLICVNIQKEHVFNDYHRLLGDLVADDVIQGVRIDHIDGLYDPANYLKQLRQLLGKDVYIVVEKILERNEHLPEQWPVQGSTGYDFLAQVNNLLTNTRAEQAFDEVYHRLEPKAAAIEEQIYLYKKMILDRYMQGELGNLTTQFLMATHTYLAQSMVEEKDIRTVIAEMLICCPVYRYYPESIPFGKRDMNQFKELVAAVSSRNKCNRNALDHFAGCFTDRHLLREPEYCRLMLHFWRRFMQLSGPLMAKGIEDTLIYNYHRFIGHNEVGDSPSFFGISVKEFHELMEERASTFPLSMNATATHDTKRGEDSRARLQALSARFKDWFDHVKVWISESKPASNSLSLTDQYFVLQAVYAALEIDGKTERDNFNGRLKDFLTKAARESKSKSSWDEPNETYETDLYTYALHLVEPKNRTGKGIRKYLKAQGKTLRNASLSQLVLKCTCPGVPDIYQGTEFWDLSFVDPDNRQAVDYTARIKKLNLISDPDFDIAAMLQQDTDPTVKLFCLHKLLQLRKSMPELFARGSYEPVYISSQYFSFIRSFKSDWIMVVIPLYEDNISVPVTSPIPMHAPETWRNIFSGDLVKSADIDIASALNKFPVVVLKAETIVTERSAGLLLPLFSLPSPYGVGDMGKTAFDFIRFLKGAGQKIWQILPLNPVLKQNFYSPYACSSAFAGDPMYIDLYALKQDELLDESDLLSIEIPASRTVDYAVVTENRHVLLAKAWQQFQASSRLKWNDEFQDFCSAENHWLDDYVLYVSLREDNGGKPWYEWPQPFRDRSAEDISQYKRDNVDKLQFQRWLQFIFFRQWQKLKTFANVHNVKFIGDIPFYMSNDSAEVWSNRSLFHVGQAGDVRHIAGVPPDYFSDTGQLWGMPTYHWEEHKREGYRWWLARLRQNVRLYDLVRLDHFRAFYDYWEIPAGADTAIHGEWRKGPQDGLFNEVKKHFPDMPFIAEDLGEIHKGVFDFIDQYRLPGMRVLQFGFNDYKGTLRDVPHNFIRNAIVYTGTHDNNTILGWFDELDRAAVKALSNYVGHEVMHGNVVACMIEMAYGTVARNLIIPMQDILGLDSSHRINTPSTISQNWKWRMLPGENTVEHMAQLLLYVKRYNR